MAEVSTVFLMYHELELAGRNVCQSEAGYVLYVISDRQFREQMAAIRQQGFQGISVTEAIEFKRQAVAITVDDGCETDLLAVAPVLKQFGFGATFYITAAFLGKPGYLSAAQLCELSELGFEIGSHSMTHPYLSDLDEAGLVREIVESKKLLEQILGKRVEHFSCPGGRYDSRVADIAKEAGYRSVSTSNPCANSPSTNPFALGRVAITRDLDMTAFQKLCRGEALWKFGLRVRLRDSAKSLLGNAAYDKVRTAILGK